MKKPLLVLKFGGTSVGSIERIRAVAERIIASKNSGYQLVVVVSAMSGETNRLMGLAQEIDSVPTARELDVLLTAGEQVSMSLLAMELNRRGYLATSLTGGQAQIVTDNVHNDATIQEIKTDNIRHWLEDDYIVIVAGFQGVNRNGDITTLGRGGSDTSAVALAGALNATECQIFTDVDGIYSCDPRVVKNAVQLQTIDFPNMEEMARKGAKVLHLPCVQDAWRNQIPLRVRSSFSENSGTLVKGETCQHGICGIAIQRDLIFVQVDKEDLDGLIKQCQILAIAVWTVIEETERTGVVINHSAYAKLGLVFTHKIRNSEQVSSLTSVGSKAKRIVEHSCECLASCNIDVFASSTGEQYSLLLLNPANVEEAANIIHNKYIVSKEALEQQ
ncbi:aspartate kinase [Vibrio sp. 99-8-1]|uniref:aspartate kinase n=1 Tax=Vibrio sp. 99-8-1 TaxID=2607602 RepID=UPI001493721B|nr:aspartate kinase [Vibrio sp. 99-8-1]